MKKAESGDGYMRKNIGSKGAVFASFGLGLILAICFPAKIMLFILAVMLIILGIYVCV
ncbi:MAG: hypothetical protein MJ177_07780 [Clostridia bacterium]|nr:hypothetical protein [Clostridia bacterium]